MLPSNRFSSSRSLIWVLGLWAACGLQGTLVGTSQPLLALALPSALLLGGLLWFWMPYVPVLVVVSAWVSAPANEGLAAKLNLPLLLTAAALGVLILSALVQDGIRPFANRTTLPLLGLALVAILAFLSGWFETSGSSRLASAPLRAQVGGLALFLLSAGAVLLSLHPRVRKRHQEVLTFGFLALGGLYSLRFLHPGVAGVVDTVLGPEATNGVFWTWLVALGVGQCLLNQRLGLHWRLACGLIVGVSLWWALTSNVAWATGWLPPLVAALAVIWISSPRWGMVLALAALLIAGTARDELMAMLMVGDQQYSLDTRWEAIKILYPLMLQHPLLGLGMANYYYNVAFFPILGWFVPFSSHNNYVDLVAQTGILGLGCFLWFSFELLRLIWGVRGRVREGFDRGFLYACWGGWMGTLVAAALADWVIPFVYNVGLPGFRSSVLAWLFAGAAIARARSVGKASPRRGERQAA